MAALTLGMLVFVSIHLLPCSARVRAQLVAGLGEGIYKGAFSVLAAGGLAMIVFGMGRAAFVPIWTPPPWGRHLAWLLVALGFISLVAAYLPSNLRRYTAHPMLWGVVLWAVGHLLANGDLASVILFGGFLLYALGAIACAHRRGARPSDCRYRPIWDLVAAAVGLAAYVAVLSLHPWLFGVAAVP